MRRRVIVLSLALALAATAPAAGGRELRVCADPNNLPFSNDRGEGFENRLAELVASELGATLRYTWWAQRRGFVRHTVGAGLCDVVPGVPAAYERLLTTRPYYRSTYVFVSRRDDGRAVTSFDDARLRSARVGVHLIGDDYANTPPAHALARRGIVGNVVGFMVYGDYAQPNPPAALIDAVGAGAIDVAVAWGPLAGWFAPRQTVPLEIAPVSPSVDPPALPLTFAIAVGVRKGDRALRDELDAVLARRRAAVDRILADYGVPRVDVEPRRP